jgi:hypothetical protein
MRSHRSRLWWAVGASLLFHGCVVTLFCLAFPERHGDEPSAVVNLRIAAPTDYPPTIIRLDDPPTLRPYVPPNPPAPLPPDVVNEPPGTVSPVHPAMAKSTSRSPGPQVPASAPQDAANAPGAIAPLHGPLTRPGLAIVYVLDRSGSMAQGKKLAYAIALVKASLRQLGPDVRFQIVTYDSQAVFMRLAEGLGLVPAVPANIAEAERTLEALAAEGSSRHAEGLRAALSLRPSVVILISDAVELSSAEVKQIKQWNRNATAMHAILLSASEEPTAALGELTGPGHIHFIAPPEPPAITP